MNPSPSCRQYEGRHSENQEYYGLVMKIHNHSEALKQVRISFGQNCDACVCTPRRVDFFVGAMQLYLL